MVERDRSVRPPTRRGVLKAGGGVLVGGLLAGCIDGRSGTGSTSSPDGEGRSVAVAPVGDVSLDTPPERIFSVYPQYADMAVALGYSDAVNSVYVPEMSGSTMNHYYNQLEGVSFDWEDLESPLSDGLAKELLYELDSDVHFADPAWVSTQKGWTQADITDVREHVAPWIGNFYSGTHADPPKGYADRYEYYTLWELFGAIAELLGEQKRYRSLKKIHADMHSTIESKLPPKNERPTAVRVTLGDGVFWTYHLNRPGYWLADTRPLGAIDAFADRNWEQLWGEVGYEAMVEADPDVILHLWGMTPDYSTEQVLDTMANHPVGKRLSAVSNDRVYAQGMRYQGPIMNLFQLEMTAKQLYPDQFGAWPGYVDGDPYPEIPEDERLFDRGRVAEIITGNA
ncbi:ABC transporter substrate-binding protein [Halocatena salina]|uniref:ABC transporter substrate-binding protein n=1 Tax=Halocatena salina TaxID=2934340 RepID=A0A8U0A2L1_9EURY|nr:ABC transporter substrate-binding protein [Halocatena salina]UPM43441.1 ABC transporter substrate-binding protein [Halocatena salina]